MKRIILTARLVLSTILVPVAASAGAPGSATAQHPAPSEQEIEGARSAIAQLDFDRLRDDRDYAREMLRHYDTVESAGNGTRTRLEIDTYRLVALRTIGDHDEIRIVVDRVLEFEPTGPDPYDAAWWAALSIPDVQRLVTIIEQASRRVPGVGWPALRDTVGPEVPRRILAHLQQVDDDATRIRFAEALLRIGWPGSGDLETSNSLRLMLLRENIDRNEIGAAADLASGLTDPILVLPLLVMRRYDALFGTEPDRLARLRTAIVDYDGQTLDALGSEARLGPTYDRVRFLRTLGRDREALELLEPFTRDVPTTVQADYRGMWIVNEAAYALLSLGRKNEAVALMERLLELPVEEDRELIGPYINHAEVLRSAGRHAEALAYAMRLDRDFSRFAGDYGKMLILSSIVCSLASLNRADEADATLERIRALSDRHPRIVMETHLCLGDMEAAEALAIQSLESEHPDSMVLAFQEYASAPGQVPDDPLRQRLMSLRDRPAVRSALERVGRVLQLPLVRINN